MTASQNDLMAVLQATLRPIDHVSFNQMYTGHSRRWPEPIFVKVFAPERQGKFLTERAINLQLTDRVLTSCQLATGEWVLVMRDLQLTPLPKAFTPELAQTMGTVLARFHQTVRLPQATRINALDFEGVADKVDQLATRPDYRQLVRLMTNFRQAAATIQAIFNRQSRVVLHGDVGRRNFQFVNGQLELIDFERAQIGYAQTDFQKLFYQDFSGQPALIAAFLTGYGPTGQLPDIAASWLSFVEAVGIFTYVQKLPDPQFEKVGQRLLAAIGEPFA